MGARSHGVLDQATEGLEHAKSAALDTASRGAEYVQRGLRRAGSSSRDFVTANPLLTALAAVAAGVGIGMLLPASVRENRLLAPPRAKLEQLVGDVRDAATDVALVAKKTAADTIQAMK